MLSLEQAQAAIAERIRRADNEESVPLHAACGRFLACMLDARVDNPAFDNSAMDGYAVNAADLAAHLGLLTVAGESRCGAWPPDLIPGTAMRIFTGAPLPRGADSVVMQEDAQVQAGRVQLPAEIPVGRHLRRRGEDFRVGERLYERGQRLRDLDLALLAAGGHAQVPVFERPRALVVATGDELVEPGQPLKPGQIYESNKLATLLQLRALGVDADDGGRVPDDADALRATLESAADYDFVITSGGVSVGDHDLVKQVFGERGEIAFWKARVKPGKPIAFGLLGRAHFFGLPGNPVSSLVTFKLFVEPAVYAWHHSTWQLRALPALARNAFAREPGRREFVRARLSMQDGRLHAEALRGQGSHQLGTLRFTDALIQIPEDSAGFAAGDVVSVVLL